MPLNPKYKMLSEEIQRRGFFKAKDRNGIDRFPSARTFVEDVNDKLSEGLNFSVLLTHQCRLSTVYETPSDLTEEMPKAIEDLAEWIYKDKVEELRDSFSDFE